MGWNKIFRVILVAHINKNSGWFDIEGHSLKIITAIKKSKTTKKMCIVRFNQWYTIFILIKNFKHLKIL